MSLPNSVEKKMAKDSLQLLGFGGILKEALKIPCRNPKLMFHVTLFSLLPLVILALGSQLSLLPLLTDMASRGNLLPTMDPGSPEFIETYAGFLKDLRIILSLEALFVLALLIVSVFIFTAMVYSSAVTFAGKQLTLTELYAKTFMFKTWKRPLLTGFYILLFSIAYVILVALVLGVFALTLNSTAVALVSSTVLVTLAAALVYYYFVVVWVLGLVISVVEENCYGLEALGKANDLIKGRKLQGFFLMVVWLLVISAISGIFGYLRGNFVDGETVRFFGIGTVVSVLVCLLKLFLYVVYTVFYFECKKSHGEKVEFPDGVGYSLIPAAPHVESTLL